MTERQFHHDRRHGAIGPTGLSISETVADDGDEPAPALPVRPDGFTVAPWLTDKSPVVVPLDAPQPDVSEGPFNGCVTTVPVMPILSAPDTADDLC